MLRGRGGSQNRPRDRARKIRSFNNAITRIFIVAVANARSRGRQRLIICSISEQL
jgi:hypothetical protein